MPDEIIPKSIATPWLLAHILTAKFADALPFYRQEKQFDRLGPTFPDPPYCSTLLCPVRVSFAGYVLLPGLYSLEY